MLGEAISPLVLPKLITSRLQAATISQFFLSSTFKGAHCSVSQSSHLMCLLWFSDDRALDGSACQKLSGTECLQRRKYAQSRPSKPGKLVCATSTPWGVLVSQRVEVTCLA